MEELGGFLTAAGGVHLPVPVVGVGTGKPGELRHDDSFVGVAPNLISFQKRVKTLFS